MSTLTSHSKQKVIATWSIGIAIAIYIGASLLSIYTHARNEQATIEKNITHESEEVAKKAAEELSTLIASRTRSIEDLREKVTLEAGVALSALQKNIIDIFQIPRLSLLKGRHTQLPTIPTIPLVETITGFTYLRHIMDTLSYDADIDWAALRLQMLLPTAPLAANGYFTVHEAYTHQIIAVGNEIDTATCISVSRDYAFFDGKKQRLWTLNASIPLPETPQPMTVLEAADTLATHFPPTSTLASATLWQGYLLDTHGNPLALFPSDREHLVSPELFSLAFDAPQTDAYWQEASPIDGITDIVRLHTAPSTFSTPAPWTVGIVTVAKRPATWITMTAILSDTPLKTALGLFFSLVAAFILGLALVSSYRLAHRERAAPPMPALGNPIESHGDEIEPLGTVMPDSCAWLLKKPAPGASLRRLQTLHRGSKEAQGAHVLSSAHSPLLRELARRVRANDMSVQEHLSPPEDMPTVDILRELESLRDKK